MGQYFLQNLLILFFCSLVVVVVLFYYFFLFNWELLHFQGRKPLKITLLPSEKNSIIKEGICSYGKNLLSWGANSFLLQ